MNTLSIQDKLKSIKSEELLSRFRSKEDLYRYITTSMGLFMPSLKGTKVVFLRAIFCNKKKALKQTNVHNIVVPHYEELSVKNLYADAMKDPLLKDYIPDLEQNSNRFPERDFFFGILGTLRPLYLTKIIEDANKVRYEADVNDPQKDFIMLDAPWYEELMKYPYFSKKPGKAIFLMKQRAKLIKAKRKSIKHPVSQRLSGPVLHQEEQKMEGVETEKRRHLEENAAQAQQQRQQSISKQKQNLGL